jgi:regulatory protein
MRPRRPRTPPEPPDAARALEIAVTFLGARPRTHWELDGRLRRAGADDEVIAATTSRLAELGYLDDAAFARWWGDQRDRHAPRGRRMVEAELRQRGVPREVVETFREEHAAPERRPEDARLPADEPARARDALARHLRGRPMPRDTKARQRVGMYLMRRGFDGETVRAAIREVELRAGDPSDEIEHLEEDPA